DLVRYGCLLAFSLFPEDGEAGLELRWLYIGDEAGEEATAEAILQGGDGPGWSVGGDHDLFRRAVEGVEGVEELLLEAFLVLHELDVVDQEHVALPVPTFERRRRVRPDGVHELVHERLGGDVPHVAGRKVLPDVITDGME